MADERPVLHGQTIATRLTICHACPVREKTICAAHGLDDLHRLDAIAQRIEVKAPKHIFLEADKAEAFYVITDGVVILSKLLRDGRRQITGLMFAGDFLGLATDGTYDYSAEPVGNVALCRLSRIDLRDHCAEFPEMEHRLLQYAAHELATARDHVLLLGRMNATQRVASLLLMLQTRQDRAGEPPTPVVLPLARAEIADYLGLRLETVGRALAQLVDAGVIDVPRPRLIVVVDQNALNDVANGAPTG